MQKARVGLVSRIISAPKMSFTLVPHSLWLFFLTWDLVLVCLFIPSLLAELHFLHKQLGQTLLHLPPLQVSSPPTCEPFLFLDTLLPGMSCYYSLIPESHFRSLGLSLKCTKIHLLHLDIQRLDIKAWVIFLTGGKIFTQKMKIASRTKDKHSFSPGKLLHQKIFVSL